MNFWNLVQKIWEGFKQQTNRLPDQVHVISPGIWLPWDKKRAGFGATSYPDDDIFAVRWRELRFFLWSCWGIKRRRLCRQSLKCWSQLCNCLLRGLEAWSWRWDSLSRSACWLAKSFASFICFCCVSASCCWLGEQCWLHVRCCSCGCALKDDAVDELLEGVKNQLGGCRRVDWSWLLSLKVVAAVVYPWWLFMLL